MKSRTKSIRPAHACRGCSCSTFASCCRRSARRAKRLLRAVRRCRQSGAGSDDGGRAHGAVRTEGLSGSQRARRTAAGTPAVRSCWEGVASPLRGRERARVDAGELSLPTFAWAAHADPLNRATIAAIAAGVSTRRYETHVGSRCRPMKRKVRCPRARYRAASWRSAAHSSPSGCRGVSTASICRW